MKNVISGVFLVGILFSVSAFADTRSCDEINQALALLPPEGGQVVLQAATYICNTPVVLNKDNTTLIGAGRGQTILKAADGKALPVLILGWTETAPDNDPIWGWQFYPIHVAKNLHVSHLSVDGNMGAHANPGDFECYDPEADTSQSCANDGGKYIRNNGITIRHVDTVEVSDVDTENNFSGGMVLEKRSVNVVVDGFETSGNFYDGFAGYETTNSALMNFYIHNNAYSGISVDMGYNGNKFDNGKILNNGDNAVFSAKVGNEYSNILMQGNKSFGLYITGNNDASGAIIPDSCDNNVITNLQIDTTDHPGIEVNSTCQNMQIVSTQIVTANPTCVFLPFPDAQVTQTNVGCSHPATN